MMSFLDGLVKDRPGRLRFGGMRSIGLLFTLVAGLHSLSAAPATKPNILVILADDLGWGELGCQGFTKQISTPQIDSIAKNGVRFTQGYVSGPYCSPTRAGFMTGRYQTRFGHEVNPGPAEHAVPNFGLPLEEKTIGNRLKDAGYATGWIGKSHLGYKPEFHPLKRGFDEFFGFLGGAHSYFDPKADAANPILRGTEVVDKLDYTTDAFGREAVDFIERHHAAPWFCYLSFNAVHSPMEATKKYEDRFPDVQDPKRKAFCGMLSAMDDAVGQVLAKLREHNLEDDTLIFFFSDNGGPTPSTTSGNGPLRGFKSSTWEGGVRVPFLMQWKGTLPAARVDDRPVIQLDILPTALAAAGVEAQPDWKLDGVNLLPFLGKDDKISLPHETLFWRFARQMALRKGDWKIVKAQGMPVVDNVSQQAKTTTEGVELYNLAKDIGETKNLAASEPEKVKELCAAWDAMNAGMVDAKWQSMRMKALRAAGKGKKKKAEE